MEQALFNSLDINKASLRLLNAVLGFIANVIVNNDVIEFLTLDKQFVIKMAMFVVLH